MHRHLAPTEVSAVVLRMCYPVLLSSNRRRDGPSESSVASLQLAHHLAARMVFHFFACPGEKPLNSGDHGLGRDMVCTTGRRTLVRYIMESDDGVELPRDFHNVSAS